MRRPLHEVRRTLGVDDRPPSPAHPEPKSAPALAHVVFNVPDVERAVLFYQRVHGYTISARDHALGVVFMTAGDDHHTIALQESLSLTPLGLLRGLERLRALSRGRRGNDARDRSENGRKRVLPPLSVVRASLRPGLNHAGYRVADEADLRAYVRRLRSAGVKIDWMVNHHDLIKGIYFRDPAGNLCELFVDGERAKSWRDDRDAPRALHEELRNYELTTQELGL